MSEGNIGYSKLAVGLLNQVDLASSIVQALKLVDDTNGATNQLNIATARLHATKIQLGNIQAMCSMTGKDLLAFSIQQSIDYGIEFLGYSRDACLNGVAGFGATAAMIAQRMKIEAQQAEFDLCNAVIYDVPESVVRTKALQYYLSQYRPAIPSEDITIEQYIRGNLTATQAAEFLAEKGVPDNLAGLLYDHYEKYPSVRELIIASQYTNITDNQLVDSFKYSGITTQANKQFFLNYAHSVQLRNELNAYLTYLKNAYIEGLLTRAQLSAEIAAHKPNANEQGQILTNCDKEKERSLMNMEVQTKTWLYRKGIYGDLGGAGNPEYGNGGTTEDTFYWELTNMSVDASVANAIVRFEAAKVGIDYERT